MSEKVPEAFVKAWRAEACKTHHRCNATCIEEAEAAWMNGLRHLWRAAQAEAFSEALRMLGDLELRGSWREGLERYAEQLRERVKEGK